MHNSDDTVSADLLVMDEEVKWDNDDNSAFYEALKVEGLKKFAEKAGLSTGCDMRELRAYWSTAKSILEAGTGYGRVIDYLIKNQYQGTITAIERCNMLFQYLKTRFCQYENINLLQTDIRYLSNSNSHFDLILYMWSGIADFSYKEQPFVIKKLAKLLQKNGKLVIDTLSMNIVPLGVKKLGDQLYLLKVNDFHKYIYEPNSYEIEYYAKNAGFANIKRISYQTDTLRERWLYILS